MDASLCVICCQIVPKLDLEANSNVIETSFPGCQGSKDLNHFLYVYFITRKLLRLPDDKCLLAVNSSVSDSTLNNYSANGQLESKPSLFRLCEKCEYIVKQAIEFHFLIQTLQKKINDLGESLQELIKIKSGDHADAEDAFIQLRNIICSGAEHAKQQIDEQGGNEAVSDHDDIREPSSPTYPSSDNDVVQEIQPRLRSGSKKARQQSRNSNQPKVTDGKDEVQEIQPRLRSGSNKARQPARNSNQPKVTDVKDEVRKKQPRLRGKYKKGRKKARKSDQPKVIGGKRKYTFKKRVMGLGPGPYVCKKCNVVYKTLANFRYHEEEHKKSDALNHIYDCDKCGFPASTNAKLANHQTRAHQHQEQDREIELKLYSNFLDPSSGKYRCPICPFEGDLDGIVLHRNNIHRERELKIDPTCDICQKVFKTICDLRLHLKIHRRYDKMIDPQTGLYHCPSCPFQGQFQAITSHIFMMHKELQLDPTDQMNHLCSQCGKTYRNVHVLRTHIKNKHENRFKFNCDVCGKGFENKTGFEKHTKTHSKNRSKEFVCSSCGVAYLNKRSIVIHMAQHHPEEATIKASSTILPLAGKKGNFKCNHCDLTFPFLQLLYNQHMPTAHPELYKFKCDKCDKAYVKKKSLTHHKLAAHSEGPLPCCKFCGKSFKLYYIRNIHQRTCPEKTPKTNSDMLSTLDPDLGPEATGTH